MRLFDINLVCHVLYMKDIGMMYEVLRTLGLYSGGLYGRLASMQFRPEASMQSTSACQSSPCVCDIPMDAWHCILFALDIPWTTIKPCRALVGPF